MSERTDVRGGFLANVLLLLLLIGAGWLLATNHVLLTEQGVSLIKREVPGLSDVVVDVRSWERGDMVRNEAIVRSVIGSGHTRDLPHGPEMEPLLNEGVALETAVGLVFGANPAAQRALEAGTRAVDIGRRAGVAAEETGLDETSMETAAEVFELTDHGLRRYQEFDDKHDATRRGAAAAERVLSGVNRGLGLLNKKAGGGS